MLDWKNIDDVFLDMDGTLLDLAYDNHFWQQHVPLRYAQARGMTVEQALAELVPRFKAAEGGLDWYCLDFWSRELALDIPALKLEVADGIRLRPHVLEFLQALRSSGKRVVMATNAHPKALELKMARVSLGEWFVEMISSHQLGAAKEQAEFWHSLQTRLPFEPSRSLMVDDSLPVLRAARRHGLQVLAITAPDSGREPLRTDEFPAVDHFSEVMPIG